MSVLPFALVASVQLTGASISPPWSRSRSWPRSSALEPELRPGLAQGNPPGGSPRARCASCVPRANASGAGLAWSLLVTDIPPSQAFLGKSAARSSRAIAWSNLFFRSISRLLSCSISRLLDVVGVCLVCLVCFFPWSSSQDTAR